MDAGWLEIDKNRIKRTSYIQLSLPNFFLVSGEGVLCCWWHASQWGGCVEHASGLKQQHLKGRLIFLKSVPSQPQLWVKQVLTLLKVVMREEAPAPTVCTGLLFFRVISLFFHITILVCISCWAASGIILVNWRVKGESDGQSVGGC